MLRKRINNILQEATIDWTRDRLDPQLFAKGASGFYSMKPGTKEFLLDVVETIDKEIVPVEDAFIKGSILSFQWLDHTDVDVLIETSPMSSDRWRSAQDAVDERFNGVSIPGTDHPLQVYVHPGKYDIANADGVYCLDDRGWIKGPYNMRVDIDDYMSKFRKTVASLDLATGELKRDLVDYSLMEQIPQDQVEGIRNEMQKKLQEINQDVEDIVYQYRHIRTLRHTAFAEDMTPEQIIEYGSKNNLPENVIFKLLERYHYLVAGRKLKSLLDGGIESDEVDDVRDALRSSGT